MSLYIYSMKAVKNPSKSPTKKTVQGPKRRIGGGGGSVANSSLYQTRKTEAAMSKKLKALEAQIEKVKGTPAAKPLVQRYRLMTGTQK